MQKILSFSNITAGFVTVLVGFTSSVAIVFQAATAAGATPAEVSSWLLALGVGMGVTCIALSFYYRMPILTAWSTPGAALLVTSLAGATMPEAIGVFIFSAILIILAGVTGLFEKAMRYVPRSLAAAMLAGILLHFGLNIFVAMQEQCFLVCAMLATYIIGKRFFPRMVIIFTLLVGVSIAYFHGLLHHTADFHIALSSPIWTTPVFSWHMLIGIGIPLFIVSMTSQNMAGIAFMHAAGYEPPISPLISWTGFVNLLLAPFGGYTLNLAAITAAICLSREADPNPATRYKAAMCAGVFYLLAGLFSATVTGLLMVLPKELVFAIAGLALLSTISSSLKTAVENETQLEAALITLLVSASGISFWGISAAFWGLAAGIISLKIFNHRGFTRQGIGLWMPLMLLRKDKPESVNEEG